VRVATFNLLSGRSLDDGRADPAALADAVRSLDADVLALQEVDRHQPRSGGADQVAVAADAMGAVDWRFVPLVRGTPGVAGWRPTPPDPAPGEPSYGIALLSRRRVRSWRVLRLGRARGRYPIVLPTTPPQVVWINDEPRAAVVAELDGPRLTVAATHLSFVPGMNVVQLRRLRAALAGLPAPRLLVGDLNLPGRLPARVLGWRPLATGPTFPAPAPRLQIDHVLADGVPPDAVAGAEVVHLPVSDHRALAVDLMPAALAGSEPREPAGEAAGTEG
jgi:endonuclease/exonuclease/phosphatase family metal-dependent hydrolase